MGQRAAIYARVSTADQSCERQIAELTAFAERDGFEVLGVFKETASGARHNRIARTLTLVHGWTKLCGGGIAYNTNPYGGGLKKRPGLGPGLWLLLH